MTSAVGRLSPVSITTGLMPERFQLTNRISRFRSNGIRQRDQSAHVMVAADHDHRLTRAAPLLEGLMKLGSLLRTFLEVPV